MLFELAGEEVTSSLNDFLWHGRPVEAVALDVTPDAVWQNSGHIYLVPSSIKPGESRAPSVVGQQVPQQLLAWLIGRDIVGPIVRLTGTAQRIQAGDLTAQAEVTTADEIGILGNAFNAMTSKLRATLQSLLDYLEQPDVPASWTQPNAGIRRARLER